MAKLLLRLRLLSLVNETHGKLLIHSARRKNRFGNPVTAKPSWQR
jgi:hypothetical protein